MVPDRGCVGIRQALTDIGERDAAAQYAGTRTRTRVPLLGDGENRSGVTSGIRERMRVCSPSDPSLGVASGKIRAAFVSHACRVPRESSRKSHLSIASLQR